MKNAVSNLKRLFFFTNILGVPLRVRQSLLAFFSGKNRKKSAQTCRSFLNANPIGALFSFLLFNKKT